MTDANEIGVRVALLVAGGIIAKSFEFFWEKIKHRRLRCDFIEELKALRDLCGAAQIDNLDSSEKVFTQMGRVLQFYDTRNTLALSGRADIKRQLLEFYHELKDIAAMKEMIQETFGRIILHDQAVELEVSRYTRKTTRDRVIANKKHFERMAAETAKGVRAARRRLDFSAHLLLETEAKYTGQVGPEYTRIYQEVLTALTEATSSFSSRTYAELATHTETTLMLIE